MQTRNKLELQKKGSTTSQIYSSFMSLRTSRGQFVRLSLPSTSPRSVPLQKPTTLLVLRDQTNSRFLSSPSIPPHLPRQNNVSLNSSVTTATNALNCQGRHPAARPSKQETRSSRSGTYRTNCHLSSTSSGLRSPCSIEKQVKMSSFLLRSRLKMYPPRPKPSAISRLPQPMFPPGTRRPYTTALTPPPPKKRGAAPHN